MRRLFILLCVIFLSGVGSYAGGLDLHRGGTFNFVPEPRLVYPTSDEVSLKGKDTLEFKWINDYFDTYCYEFRLYKGYNFYADALLIKENIDPSRSTFEIKADFFGDGQVYTWSIKRVSHQGVKSDRSFNSFRVSK